MTSINFSLLTRRIFRTEDFHHYHRSCITSAFSHQGWGRPGDNCPPSILPHVPLHSQQVYILHRTITPLFPRPSCWPSPLNSHLPYLSGALELDIFPKWRILPDEAERESAKNLICTYIYIFTLTKSSNQGIYT